MGHGIENNYVSSDRSATAKIEVAKPNMDAKASTHLCSSPFASAGSETAIGQTSAYLIMVSGGIPGTMFRLVEQAASFGRSNGVHLPGA